MRAAAALIVGGAAGRVPRRAGAAAVRYPTAGQLLAVQLDTGELLVKHDAVPGYMDAMTMPFRVADRTAIRDRRPGDSITATLVVEPDRSYLEDVQLTGTAPLGDAAPPRPVAEGAAHPGTRRRGARHPARPTHRGDAVSLAGVARRRRWR